MKKILLVQIDMSLQRLAGIRYQYPFLMPVDKAIFQLHLAFTNKIQHQMFFKEKAQLIFVQYPFRIIQSFKIIAYVLLECFVLIIDLFEIIEIKDEFVTIQIKLIPYFVGNAVADKIWVALKQVIE